MIGQGKGFEFWDKYLPLYSSIYLTQDLLNEVSSPDISDLQKRFDIIAARASTSSDLQDNEDEEGDSSCEIELPEHLQKMVDNALAQMSE